MQANTIDIQSYTLRMRLQSRLYGTYLVLVMLQLQLCKLVFTVQNCLVYYFLIHETIE